MKNIPGKGISKYKDPVEGMESGRSRGRKVRKGPE